MKNKLSFMKYLEELEQSAAIVRPAQNPAMQMLDDALKYIDQAKNYLLKLVSSLSMNEARSGFAEEMIIKFVENDDFSNYLKTKFGNIRPTSSRGAGYHYACGMDSCAFFYTNNHVVKFLGGPHPDREFNIANSVKGQLNLVPILDAFVVELPHEGKEQFVVVMKKLETDFFQFPKYIVKAANSVSDIVHELQNLVERSPNISPEYIRRRLTSGYIIHRLGQMDENVVSAIKDIMRIIRTVYDKSGMVFGADLSAARNIGIERKANRIMIYDYGRSDVHPRKQRELEKQEPERLNF